MNNDVTGASLLVREKERCIILATATESLPSSTSPPPVFHQIHQDTIHPKALWKSQNTPLPHSHLPTNMITFRVLTLAHNHSFDQSKTVLPALLDLLFFFFSPFHGMVSASHLSIKGKFIWQCAVTTLRTSSMLPMHTFRNHMLVYWTEVLRLECLDRRNKLLPIFWHRFQLYIINMCWNVFIRPQEAAETHWWKRGNIANSPHCRKTP